MTLTWSKSVKSTPAQKLGSRRTFLQAAAGAVALGAVAAPEEAVFAAPPANGIPKGLALVLLSYWPTASLNRLTSVLKEARMPSRIEFTFCPYVDGLRKPVTYFQNARIVIDRLASVGRRPSVVVYLSFHAGGANFDDRIKSRAATFVNEFASEYATKCDLTVVPSLEDVGTTADFVRWVGILKNAIPANLRSKMQLRRNNNGSVDLGNLGAPGFKAVTTEQHGGYTAAPNVYSNDGNMVYVDNTGEGQGSLIGGNTPTYSLDKFIGFANGQNTVNLWRPAYNQLKKTVVNGQVTYSRDGRELGSDTFDDFEQSVVRRFMGGA